MPVPSPTIRIQAPSVDNFHAAARIAARTDGQLTVDKTGQFTVKHQSWFGRKVAQIKQRFFPNKTTNDNQRVLYSLAYALGREKDISRYGDLSKLTARWIKAGATPGQVAARLDHQVRQYEAQANAQGISKPNSPEQRAAKHADGFLSNYFNHLELDKPYEYTPYAQRGEVTMRRQAEVKQSRDFRDAAFGVKGAYCVFASHVAAQLKNANWVPGTESGLHAPPCKTSDGRFTDGFLLRMLNMTVRQETGIKGAEKDFLPAANRGQRQVDAWLQHEYQTMRADITSQWNQ